MNWNTILSWFQSNAAWLLPVLVIVIGLGIQVARGKGKQLAQLALDFLLLNARLSLDEVTKADIDTAVRYFYDLAPATIWIVPWKALVSCERVMAYAWQAFNQLHEFLDTAGAITLKSTLKRARVGGGNT